MIDLVRLFARDRNGSDEEVWKPSPVHKVPPMAGGATCDTAETNTHRLGSRHSITPFLLLSSIYFKLNRAQASASSSL